MTSKSKIIKDGRTLHGTTHVIFQHKDDIGEEDIGTASVPLLKSRQSTLQFSQPFHPNESHVSLKDRQKIRSLLGIETEPVLPVCLADPWIT